MANAVELVLRDGATSWIEADDGTVVILDLRTSRYLSVNKSASLLWRSLIDGATQDSLEAQLRDRFGVDGARASTDVISFLGELRQWDLLLERPTG